ncbi:hypothetical protein [Tenacibaculum sp. 190524A05c]|uniref:hypothetical protein n=1 Tax=Tenacibaculum platacis TaxID=3137852 RepID=UPI0032B2D8C2
MKLENLQFMILFFIGMELFGQYKYKLEADVQINSGSYASTSTFYTNTSNVDFALNPFNGGFNTPLNSMFFVTVYQGNTSQSRSIQDKVLEFTAPVREVVVVNQTFSSPFSPGNKTSQKNEFNSCFIANSYNLINVNYFRLYRLKTLQELNLDSGSNEIKECEPYNLQVYEKACANYISYALEYSINSGPWKTYLPFAKNPPVVSITKNNLVGIQRSDNVNFRVKYLNTGSNNYSDIITLNYKDCSPQLDEIVTVNAQCNYSNDGGFRISFQRDLNPNEKLIITLYDGIDDSILINQESTTSLINSGTGTYFYDWQMNLAANTYRVKYQTLNGTGNIPTSDPSWDILEFSPIFSITKPAKVVFSIDSKSEENCFNEKDGYIEVSASREPGRGLFFQLTKDGTVQIFNGTNWVNYTGANPNDNGYNAFTSATTTRINKLGKGIYRVKVRDSQKCYMK